MGVYVWGLLLVSSVFVSIHTLSAATGDEKSRSVLKLALKEATERALKNSPRLAKSEADFEKSEAAAAKAWAPFYPRLDINAGAGTFHDRVPNPGDPEIPLVARDRNSYHAQLVMNQSLFAGFGDSATLSAARRARESAQWTAQSEKNAVTEQVIGWYYGVQMRQRQIEAEKEASTLRQSQLVDVQRRVGAGTATDLERLEAEYSLKSQEPVLENLKSELELMSLRLSRLLGLELDASLELTDSLETANAILEGATLPSLADAFKIALAKNPDANRMESDVERYDSESRGLQAKHLPKLDLQLAAGTNAFTREDIATQNSLVYSGQLLLTVPLFSGLQSVYERRERNAGMLALRKDQALLREKILDDLDGAYHQWKLSIARITSETASVRLAEEAARRARIVYRAGRATTTDVLDAYSRLVSAKKNHAQAMYERITSVARIRALLGSRVE